MKISILVVLYNCEIENSKTLISLASLPIDFAKVQLVIWNNGPKKLSSTLSIDFNDVVIIETIQNRALSDIYNYFIKTWPADRVVILDHDSELNLDYIGNVLDNKDVEIGVPLIEKLGAVRSPIIDGGFHLGPFTNDDRIRAIGSGVILSNRIIEIIVNKYGNVFDPKFYLYGVDTSLFIRIKKENLTKFITIISNIEHSLSSFEKESKKIKAFRNKERSYDLGLTMRYYPSIPILKEFIKVLIRKSLGKSNIDMMSVFCAFFTGEHYRSKKK